jgi:hypothetical protein
VSPADTKTRKSRRTLKLPQRCVEVLRDHQQLQDQIRKAAGGEWQDNDLVFLSRVGTRADASHVRRAFRQAVAIAGHNDDGNDLRQADPSGDRARRRCDDRIFPSEMDPGA